ncbi:MAG: class I SAM-dependent methyltransferase [Myxococcales bacterium]|nr:class I SAM-dependent methyltransferase [Myxococcales bacterium]
MPLFTPQNDRQLQGEVAFRRFHALGVNEQTLSYMELCLRERRDIFRHLALGERRLTPFLEIGAETGANSLILAGDLRAEGMALDISREALAAMTAYAERLAVDHLPRRVWGDAHALPLRNESLPFALAWGTLHHFPDPRPVLAELRRVLTPGGCFLVGDEPVRRRLSLHLTRTRALHSLGPLARRLLRWHVLPWLVDIDGREAVAAGVAEMQFSRRAYKDMLAAAFEEVEMQYAPYITERIRSAGPLGRLLLAPLGPALAVKAEVQLFGGAIGAFCRKNPESHVQCLTDGRAVAAQHAPTRGAVEFLLRKRPEHNRLWLSGENIHRLRVFVERRPVALRNRDNGNGLWLELPPAAVPRGTIHLRVDSGEQPARLEHFVFSRDGEAPWWIPIGRNEPPADRLDEALGCPSCWWVGEDCRPEFCGGRCVGPFFQVHEGRAEPVDPRAELPWELVQSCPVQAIDRPPLTADPAEDGRIASYRCPQCERVYPVENGIVDLRSPRARRLLAGPDAPFGEKA